MTDERFFDRDSPALDLRALAPLRSFVRLVEVRPKVIRDFERDGVVVMPGFLTELLTVQLPYCVVSVRDGLQRGALTRDGRFVKGKLPETLELIHRSLLIRTWVSMLLGPHVALYFSRLLLKDSEFSGAVELHQDMPYFTGGPKISAFVPLAPMRANDGGLCFVKGSHKYGMLERGVIQLDKFPPMEHLRPDLEPGDVIFMDFLTWHYSGPCYSERPLMQITFQPATDGSYFDLPGPTLVSGEWQTSYFVEKGKCVKPDAA